MHALAHAMNTALGNVGETVIYTDPIEVNPTDQMRVARGTGRRYGRAGQVQTLLIFGGNPVYNAPADLQFAQQSSQGARCASTSSLYEDETAELCHWHIPEAHFLETWGDARAFDGTVTIHSAVDCAAVRRQIERTRCWRRSWAEDVAGARCREAIGRTIQCRKTAGDDEAFEEFWETSLNNGVVAETALPAKQVRLSSAPADGQRRSQANSAQQSQAEGGLEIVFRPDPTIWDGRFANNGWLQELPRPLTKSPGTTPRAGERHARPQQLGK